MGPQVLFRNLLSWLSMSAPPLTGIKVIELAGLAPAPFCGQILADFGADVVRVDRPTSTGDMFGRGKRSICLDLKKSVARSLLLRLLQGADVLIEPYPNNVFFKFNLTNILIFLPYCYLTFVDIGLE